MTPDGRAADGRKRSRDRRRRADRHRARQPVHEPPAGPPGARDPRGDRRVGGARRVRVQRRDAAGRDGWLRPRRPRRRARAGTAPATCPTSCWPTTGSTRSRRPAGSASPSGCRWPPTAAVAPPRLVLDDLVDPGERPPPRPGAAGRRDHRRVGARGRPPAAARASPAPTGRPERRRCRGPTGTSWRRSARSSPPSTRRGPATAGPRSPASGPASRRGSPPVAPARRPPRRPSRGRDPRRAPHVGSSLPDRALRVGRRPGALPPRLAARPVPRPWIAQPRRRPRPPRVRRPGRRGARSSPVGSRTSGCRRHGACGAGSGSSPGRAPSRSPRSSAGSARAPRCSSSRRARSRAACAASSTGSSTPSRRTCSGRSRPSGRQLAAIDALEADGRLGEQPRTVRAVAEARRETPEASLSEIADAPRPPPVGGPAGARPARAARAPRRRGHRPPRPAGHRRRLGRRGPAVAGRSGRRRPRPGTDGRLWHDQAMRPIVIAANWKMNTTPADAGDLARTIASRTREPGVTRVICPPFVCLAAVRDALAGEDVGVGAQNVHHELAGAYTGRGVGAHARRARHLGDPRPLRAARAVRRDRRPDRPQARPCGRRRAAPDPVRRRGPRGPRGRTRGRGGRRRSSAARSTAATRQRWPLPGS